ncbi:MULTISPECIES: DUF7718 family protein [Halorussus]|uniref:DUF7718 family protein n=1 Tax=Halorussus TaxID=1070314 RepID=UPI00209F3F7B|nr:hypothetical protein [Halorussus vallis]USZ78626.1 hypothetical protein NGM07_25085 [Halorussus vallis]
MDERARRSRLLERRTIASPVLNVYTFSEETMTDGPREYDREFSTPHEHRVRRRIGYSHDHGEVTRFVVQLEYKLDDRWAEIVRFDHDPASDFGHDVSKEGVHMDVYRDGEKIQSEEVFPPMPPDEALTFAEEHLNQHAERYIKRFEEWHGIRNL